MYIPEILYKYGFGVRSLTFADFEAAAAESGFKVFYTDEKLDDGLSYPRTRNGQKHRVIVLRRTLFEPCLTETAWHEFGHAANEDYGVRSFVQGSEEKCEQQVIDLSLCCLIPTLWIRTKTWNELREMGFTDEQIFRRKEIYDSTGI